MLARLFAAALLTAFLAGCNDAPKADALDVAARELDAEATDTTGIILGVVVDTSITPLAGANVTILSLNRTTATNEAGAFAFEGLEAGTYFLTASLVGYTTVQQSVDVAAGVQDPEAVRIQLAAIPRGEPLVVAHQATIFVDSSVTVLGGGYTLGGVTTDHSYFFNVEIEPNATVAQTEITWDAVTPMAEVANIGGGTYDDGDGVHTEDRDSASPAVFRANATTEGGNADSVAYNIFAGGSLGTPIGIVSGQQFNCVIHVFYNFEPDPDWQFGRDGEHPVPA